MKLTIKDPLIFPYEIDVENKNFILVRPKKVTPKVVVAGEEPKITRVVIGYFGTLSQVMQKIIRELISLRVADVSQYDNKIITIKQFLEVQQQQVKICYKFFQQFDALKFEQEVPADFPIIMPEHILNYVNTTPTVNTESIAEDDIVEEEPHEEEAPKKKLKEKVLAKKKTKKK